MGPPAEHVPQNAMTDAGEIAHFHDRQLLTQDKETSAAFRRGFAQRSERIEDSRAGLTADHAHRGPQIVGRDLVYRAALWAMGKHGVQGTGLMGRE